MQQEILMQQGIVVKAQSPSNSSNEEVCLDWLLVKIKAIGAYWDNGIT
jgi:hypothetical protein